MDAALQQETERLVRSWMRHDEAMLRDYLVAEVEDPRLNAQSILTRHFLAFSLLAEKYQPLAEAELAFGAAMNWLLATAKQAGHPDALAGIAHALARDADNAEGFGLPPFVRTLFRSLPQSCVGLRVPNYLEEFLRATRFIESQPVPPATVLDTFQRLWQQALAAEPVTPAKVLEPACGSANDYRFLERFGFARLIDYAGFDLCEKNVTNARRQFPQARFAAGNVFAVAASAGAYDFAFVHDLFEHLSPVGIEAAVDELCRVTRRALCLHFFNMDETAEDVIRPVEEYHWNTLSVERMRERFARHGFQAQVLHIGSFLRWRVGAASTHNPHAYTFVLGRP
jgi:SAM-dependent methyltransferase